MTTYNLLGSSTPAGSASDPGTTYTLGLKFTSSVDGFLTGLRFYKQAGDTTVARQGAVWETVSATQLGILTTSGETSSGWQSFAFSSPVPILADVVYTAGVRFDDPALYSVTSFGLASAITSGPLTALASGGGGAAGNGLFNDSQPIGTIAIPNNSFNSANYFIDVIFDDGESPGPTFKPAWAAGANSIVMPA